MQSRQAADNLREQLVRELRDRHGELVGGDSLRLLLGFRSIAAFKQAVTRKTLVLPTFYVAGRRGRFALTIDIADWLATTKTEGIIKNDQGTKPNNLPTA